VPPRDKSDLKTNGRSTEPPRRSRRAAALMVAATTAVLLSASVLWYRTHSGAIADDAVGQPSRTSPLTLDPAAFAGQAREAYQIARKDPKTQQQGLRGFHRVRAGQLGGRRTAGAYRVSYDEIPVKSESVRARISEPRSAGSGGLSNLQLVTMAIAAAVTAANLYYCQPLLSQIARSLHMTARETADIPMLTQIGYALGLLFFAPLGDMVERRGLATGLCF
jgi:hypothetical protein